MQHEFVTVDGVAQSVFDRLTLERGHIQVRFEELIVVASAVFRLVHRKVGIFEQSLGVDCVIRIRDDPDAGGDINRVLADLVRLVQRHQDLLGADARVFGVHHLGQQDHEFIAALPAHRVGVAHAGEQALGGALQQFVPDRVAQRVVDVLEVIQIEEKQRELFLAPLRQADRLSQPVAEQDPVGQFGEAVVLGQVRHSERLRPRRAHIVKDHDGARDLAAPVVDGCGRILDGGFDAVAPDQQAVRGEPDGPVLVNGHCHGIGHRIASNGVHNAEHIPQRMSGGLASGPAGQLLRDRIQISHVAPLVGAHDGVADGVQRDLGPLLFRVQRVAVGRPFDHAAQRLGQPVIVEAPLEKKILSAVLHRQPCDCFVIRSNQHQNGNLRRRLKQPVEGFDSPAVRQEQIHQHRRDAMGPVLILFSRLRQPIQTLGATPHPIDLEGSVARTQQGVSDGVRIHRIVLNQEYVLRQEILTRLMAPARNLGPPHSTKRGIGPSVRWAT